MKLINSLLEKLKSEKSISRDERNTIVYLIRELLKRDKFDNNLYIVEMSPEMYMSYMNHFYTSGKHKINKT